MSTDLRIKEFDELCASNDLSLMALQEKISLLSASDIKHISDYGSCLHKACMNSKVTLEIITLMHYRLVVVWRLNYR